MNVTSICMNLRSSNHTVDSSYTVNDLLFFIKAFSVIPFLDSLFLEGWDDVCDVHDTEKSFSSIVSALYDFLKTKQKFFIRFYNKNNTKRHFTLLSSLKNVQLSFCDEDWD